MKKVLNPEAWVTKFIKSATNGRVVSVRLGRILTLIIIPIWLAGLVWALPLFYDGSKGMISYFKEKKDKGISFYDYPATSNFDIDRGYILKDFFKQLHPSDTITGYEWMIIEGELPVPDDVKDGLKTYIPSYKLAKLKNASNRMFNMLAIPIYLLILFILPWIITRLIFWIIDADRVKAI